jgi:ribosomal peptide maturation radical SAM protein 1
MNKHYDVILAVLPWATITSPSLQVGLLKSVLQREGIAAQTAHLNVEFFKFLQARGIAESIHATAVFHDNLKNISEISPWIFAAPPVFTDSDAISAYFQQQRQALSGEDLESFELVMRIRQLVPRFFQQCAEEILDSHPKAVGFSCTFDQRTPSLVLAYMLKQADPRVKTVFGGTYMDGIMGEAFIRSFPWVDAVVRGEGEHAAPVLFRHFCTAGADDAAVPSLPGLCIRSGQQVIIQPESPGSKARLNENPVPDYDEYFERVSNTDLNEPGLIKVSVETSRGCWWFKNKCKFCGRTTESLRYRTKPLDQVARELRTLSGDHAQLDFMIVDPCVHSNFMAKLLGRLKEEGLDFNLWCQGRVEMRGEELEAIGASGVDTMFSGIESLGTPVLKLMRKGHTALEAVRFLLWGLEYNITITWNLLYGFPGEKPGYYEEMADLMQSLTHLSPPFQLRSLDFCRSSEYFDNTQQYGIELLDPDPVQDPVYHLAHRQGSGVNLRDLAGKLDGKYEQIQREPVDKCREILNQWRRDRDKNYGRLWHRRGKDFLRIFDYRTNLPQQAYTLADLEAKIYLSCTAGASLDTVWNNLDGEEKTQVPRGDVKEFLDQLVENRLVYHEDGLYLSLSISHRAMVKARGKMARME